MSWQDSMAKVKIIEEIIWHIQRVLVLFFLKKVYKIVHATWSSQKEIKRHFDRTMSEC